MTAETIFPAMTGSYGNLELLGIVIPIFKVWEVDAGDDFVLLVAAERPGKAKVAALRSGFFGPETAYTALRLRRMSQYDLYATEEAVWEYNAALPAGAPPYWDQE